METQKFRVIRDNQIVGYEYIKDGNWYHRYADDTTGKELSDNMPVKGVREQCTGRLDKNGVEIYEEDLLKWHTDETFCNVKFDDQISKVEYKNNSYVLIDIKD
jgi:hypothetical protein